MRFLNLARAQQIVLLIVASTTFQSCVVYQTTPATLNTAVNMGPVKIIDNSGTNYKFKSIELKEGVYYGIGASYANIQYKLTPEGMITVLDSTKYEAVYIKDQGKSKKRTVWTIVGLSIPAAYLVVGGIAALFFFVL